MKSKNQIQPSADRIFNFDSVKQLRMFSIDGSPWFAAQDVCDALSLTNSRMSLQALDNDEKGVSSTYTLGGQQKINVISESGLYTLILRCRDAVTPGTIPYRFRKWVTSEVLPSIRQTGTYAHRQPELLPAEPESTMKATDARRGKKETDKKTAARIAEKCVPVIMREMRESQYHYSNCDIGPAEVIPALLSDNRRGLQLHALLAELASNDHDVAGAWRELEAIRLHLAEQRKLLAELATHGQYIAQLAAK
ncbi:BRO-N domain-containing protein [Pantoea ananatis]|uniref:BRO-N domain-containing protein n=1 Tax=Pantoea ananas TaxID=553 RepID=UPI001FF08A2F|nr:BRO family protein [Pantoea ananatis]